MEDLAKIIAVLFASWLASGVALLLLAGLAPVAWSRTLRLSLMLAVATVAVFLTGALFGIGLAAVAAPAAALIVYLGARRG